MRHTYDCSTEVVYRKETLQLFRRERKGRECKRKLELHFQFACTQSVGSIPTKKKNSTNTKFSVLSSQNSSIAFHWSIGMRKTFPKLMLMLCLHLFFFSLHRPLTNFAQNLHLYLNEITGNSFSSRKTFEYSLSFESFPLKWGHTAGKMKNEETKVKIRKFPSGQEKK